MEFPLVKAAPADAVSLGVPVFKGETSGPGAELDAGFLSERGFEGKAGEVIVMPAEGGGSLVCVHDVSGRPGRFRARPADRLPAGARLVDVCDGTEHVAEVDGTVDVDLPAYGVRWLRTG